MRPINVDGRCRERPRTDVVTVDDQRVVRKLLSRDGPTHHAHRTEVLFEAGVTTETDAAALVFAGYDPAPEMDEHEAASALLWTFGQPRTGIRL